jgi:hypothetical protein
LGLGAKRVLGRDWAVTATLVLWISAQGKA